MRLGRKHTLPTRLFHGINALVLAVMIWSGLLIYWANRVYRIELFGVTLIWFFPDWFYENDLYRMDHHLAEGMAWHFAFMWPFAINGLLYVAYTISSGAWRELVPRWGTPREAWDVVRHELGVRKAPLPRCKYNAAQRLAYTGVILTGAGSILTGLAIYKPVQLAGLTELLGGYEGARLGHFVLTMGFLVFIVIHVVQVARAGWDNFRAMVIGYEVVREEGAHGEARG